MKRNTATTILRGILTKVDAGLSIPVTIEAVYVFGSYARGALEPNDIDIIIIQHADRAWLDELWDRHYLKAHGVFRRHVSDALWKRGQRVEAFIDRELSECVGEGAIDDGSIMQLWSQQDRDWDSKLAAIKPDASAGRFERNHLVSLKRLHGDDLGTMNDVMAGISDGRLVVEKIPVSDSMVPTLSEDFWWGPSTPTLDVLRIGM